MQPHLTWLALTAMLGAVLWIPYVAGRVVTRGMPTPTDYREVPHLDLPAWVRRCDRTLMNFVESFAPFAVLVIVAHLRMAGNEPTMLAGIALWAQVFFWSRVVHAVVFWLGIPYLRTLAFLGGFVSTVMVALAVLGSM